MWSRYWIQSDNRTSILSEESVGRNGTERAGCGYLCRKTLGSDSETGTGIPLWGKLSFCIDGTNPEAGYIRVSEQISGIYWIRGKNLEEKIREEMEENFKCIAGGSDGWKSWNDRICRRYVSK